MALRKVLNFGHTFAHAYEATLGYSQKLNHGEAVILGINSALKFSLLIEPSLTERINKLFYGAEKAKKSYDSDLISINSYIGEEEKFFYSAKAIYRESKNFKSVFNAVCE